MSPDDEVNYQNANDTSIIRHKEGLDFGLQVFKDNKMNKDNVWRMSLIDHFRALIDKHHESLNSFQYVGLMLEASSKIYEIRVDSLHTDILRMSSGILRQTIVVENPDEVDDEILLDPNIVEKQPVRNRKRSNRIRSTIVTDKHSINAKLETISETDPIFAKLNSTVEKTNSAKKLLQYVLPSNDSELRFRMNYKMWKSEEAPVNDANAVDAYGGPFVELPEMNWMPSICDMLRPKIPGYRISDARCEDDRDANRGMANSMEQIDIDLQFDINASVEPVDNNPAFLDLNVNEEDYYSLTEDDRSIIQTCSGFKTPRVNDMQPVERTSEVLEYSYRRLFGESNTFWAGPSYWKVNFIKRKSNQNVAATRKRKMNQPVHFEEDVDNSLFLSIDSQPVAKLRKLNFWNQRWDSRLYKLPRDWKLDRNRYLQYSLAPAVSICNSLNSTSQKDAADVDSNRSINEDNVTYDNMLQNDDENAVRSCENNEFISTDGTEISTEFDGAPSQIDTLINKINARFPKTAKFVDMKQLKFCCLNLITKDCARSAKQSDLPKYNQIVTEQYSGGSSSFYDICRELPQKLTMNMKEALSPAITFLAILHLANENNLRLFKNDDNGFLIRRIL